MAAEPGKGQFSTQLLVDLVLDPLDPGYEAAARRRAGSDTRRWYDRPAVAAGCLVIGFLLALAWVHTHRSAPATKQVHDRLVQRVRVAQARANALSGDTAKLNSDLDRIRAAALPGSSTLLRDLDRSQLMAGTIAAAGQGVEVRLSEPSVSTEPSAVPGPGNPTGTAAGHILIDRDVRSVVNQLWSDGAEAISVNQVRLTPQSAIRFAGDAVLVDLQPIDSPYVIDAIGASDLLITGFAASDVASRYQTLASAKGIGFSFQERHNLVLPASPRTTLRYAHVPGGRR